MHHTNCMSSTNLLPWQEPWRSTKHMSLQRLLLSLVMSLCTGKKINLKIRLWDGWVRNRMTFHEQITSAAMVDLLLCSNSVGCCKTSWYLHFCLILSKHESSLSIVSRRHDCQHNVDFIVMEESNYCASYVFGKQKLKCSKTAISVGIL